MTNVKDYDSSKVARASDLIIPIDDVYFALIQNNVLDMNHFSAENASATEQEVYAAFLSKQSGVLSSVQSELVSDTAAAFGDLDNEIKDYITYIIKMLKEKGILVKNKIDTKDAVYVQWSGGSISLKEYLTYAIARNWIDITKFSMEQKYSDSNEIYSALLDFIREELTDDNEFSKIIYKYIIQQNLISGTQLCILLYDQGILKQDEEQRTALTSGSISAYNFIRDKM